MTWRKPETHLRPGRPAAPVTNRPWTREQIQRARKIPLAPLLRERGYPLRVMPAGNFLIEDHQDLVVKDSYWVWPARTMKGNGIGCFMLVECRSFHEAMEILAPSDPNAED
jgi:hypothetical protein